jgi:hypothetical protein
MTGVDYARLIICEPTPRWAVLLRRFAEDLQVSEARSPLLADEMLAASPASFVAFAVNGGNAAATLNRLMQWRRDFPAATTAVLLDGPSPGLETGFREARAQLVITSLFALPMLVRLAKRHLALVEAPEVDWREAVMARMPWPAVARSP